MNSHKSSHESKVEYVPLPEPHFLLTVQDAKKPVRIDVKMKPREEVGLRSDLLARALGWKKNNTLRVVDATAGLGRDLAHLLQLKCQVLGIERHPLLAEALKAVYVRRSNEGEEKNNSLPHVEIISADAVQILSDQKILASYFGGSLPDVIFIDPMFPEKKKSAAAGKESRLLQALSAPPTEKENADLFAAACASGAKRIVVKRPLPAPHLNAQVRLSHQVQGKAIRFDVYINSEQKFPGALE